MSSKIYSFLLIILLFLTSCSTTRVYNVRDAGKFELSNNGLIYALPQTVIRIEVEATKVITEAGPYAAYAEKYLGITDAPLNDSIHWYISNLNISSYAEPDSSHFYFIESEKINISQYLNLTPEGMLVSINGGTVPYSNKTETDLFLNQVFNEPIELNQLPVMDAQTERVDTTYRTVLTDSSSMRIPVLRKQQVNKSVSAKAKEIAELILELREEKVAILIGDIDEFPDGKALGVIINEFQNIEEKYLPLFIGNQRSKQYRAVFEFTPTQDNLESKNILFRFSDQQGILSNTDLSGRPFLIEIQNHGNTNHLESLKMHVDTIVEEESGLFYRIPDIATVKVLDQDKVVATGKMPVAQYGKVVTMPVDLLMRKKGKLEFYPEYGALKRITK